MNIQQYVSRNFSFGGLIIIFLTITTSLSAQFRPFDNFEVETIKPKTLQNENYFGFAEDGGINNNTLATLLRYGLKKNFELQVQWSGQKLSTDISDETTSNSSASVGMKVYLLKNRKYIPGLSLIGNINLTPDPNDLPISPSLNLLFDKKIGSNLSINGNYLVRLDEQDSDFSTNYTVNLEAKLFSWQNTYIGLRGRSLPAFNNTGSQSYLELGLQFWVWDGITIYPFYDFGLNDNSPDTFNLGLLFSVTQ